MARHLLGFQLTLAKRQHGVLPTFLYKLFIDDYLNQLKTSNCGFRLRNFNCGNPAFTDDIVLLALSPTSMHTLINICSTYFQNWKLVFSGAKN
jgi:pantothenate kinase type III